MRVRTHKYGAKPTEVDGIRFASQKEAKRYQELLLLEHAGEIDRISCQVKYELYVFDTSVGGKLKRAASYLSNKPELAPKPKRIGRYIADFTYWTKDDKQVVEDVKGFRTPLYRWKKKHVEAQYGIQIREI